MKFNTEREGMRDWLRYGICRLVAGHKVRTDGSQSFCCRCGDVLPDGRKWE